MRVNVLVGKEIPGWPGKKIRTREGSRAMSTGRKADWQETLSYLPIFPDMEPEENIHKDFFYWRNINDKIR